MLSDQQCVFTHNLAKLILKIVGFGYETKIQELNRTLETQQEYVKSGKSKTLNSKHLDKLAADIVIFKNGVAILSGPEYRPLGEFWESLGGRWGGRFGLEDQPKEVQDKELGWDCCHFEYNGKMG